MNFFSISLTDIIALGVLVSYFVIGWWANKNSIARAPAQKQLDEGNAMDVLQANVTRALKRADDAEKETEAERILRKEEADRLITAHKVDMDRLKICHEESLTKISALELKFEDWKKTHSRYMVAFTMQFGEDDPVIHDVKGYRERREQDLPYKGENKRKKE